MFVKGGLKSGFCDFSIKFSQKILKENFAKKIRSKIENIKKSHFFSHLVHMYNKWLFVEEGINFPHDGLYVEYTLEIPPNMEILQKDAIFGRTQICFTQVRGAVSIPSFFLHFYRVEQKSGFF